MRVRLSLSADGSVSCATCHRPEHAFADTLPISPGVYGRLGRRNAISVLNVAYRDRLFVDGRVDRLEAQVLRPIEDADEMSRPLDALVQSLGTHPGYRLAFQRVFGEVSTDGVARALASYLRTLRSGNAPFDHFRDGDTAALTANATLGFRTFVGRGGCARCHIGPMLSDGEFHNTGIALRSGDVGRFGVTGAERDRGAFRTATLRNVALTAPYMHDGSIPTLEAVVEFYDRGGAPHPNLDEAIRPLGLTTEEKQALVAFLESLTDAGLVAGQRGRKKQETCARSGALLF